MLCAQICGYFLELKLLIVLEGFGIKLTMSYFLNIAFLLWTFHMTVVPRAQFSSGPEHDQLLGPNFVETLGWFEGGLYRGGG